MPRILDNRLPDDPSSGTGAALVEALWSSRSLDACVGYFNLRGWAHIAREVADLKGAEVGPKARVLIGMGETPQSEMRRLATRRRAQRMDLKTAVEHAEDTGAEMRVQLSVGRPTADDEAALRELRRQVDAGEVEVRMHTAHRLHAKMYLCHRDDSTAPRVAYVGSSNLTSAGLAEQGELNVDVLDNDATAKLAAWFDERWDDPLTVPVDDLVLAAISGSWAAEEPLDPYLVYLKMAYCLSREARAGLVRYGLPQSLQDTLLEFQEAAVKIASQIVVHRGGAMIGDVVGLGKTLVGTAVARLLQDEHGWQVLVVCPKGLVGMWQDHLDEYGVRGRAVSMTVVRRDLPELKRHGLVVIDESHNLRNPKRLDYKAIKAYIDDNDSKVLLLTATPYNKDFKDIASQLALFVDPDTNLGISPEGALPDKGGLQEVARRCDGQTTTLAAFQQSEHIEDWQRLLSLFLVRRTRRFIEDFYATDDGSGRKFLEFGDGRRFQFPVREPRPVPHLLDEGDPAADMTSEQCLDEIANLHLPRYHLGSYLKDELPSTLDKDAELLAADLLRAAEADLAGLHRIMLFKRLSSSGATFIASLTSHAMRNRVCLRALETGQPFPVGSIDPGESRHRFADDTLDDLEMPEESAYPDSEAERAAVAASLYDDLLESPPSGVRWAPLEMLRRESLAEHLRHDVERVEWLLDMFGLWNPQRDSKMDRLAEIVDGEHANGCKTLVFSEYADTARYVAADLSRRLPSLRVGCVLGGDADAGVKARRFSPQSNRIPGRSGPVVAPDDELDVLVSTDVLSEGQNLQDASAVVNYDLPWAVVRLVQRAGRVDRIGQEAQSVRVWSLLPDKDVEETIRLHKRIKDRLGENASLLGSDEAFFGTNTEQFIVEGRYDELSDWQIAAIGGQEVDPVSMAYEIWRSATDGDPALAQRVEALPDSVIATQAADQRRVEGVLVHARTAGGWDAFAYSPTDEPPRRVTPQEALNTARCEPDTPALRRHPSHHGLVDAALDGPLARRDGQTTPPISGVRKKVWQRIYDAHAGMSDNLLFTVADLAAAHDAINEHPLLDQTVTALGAALNNRSDQDLAALLVRLHHDNELCHQPTDSDDAQILAAMGFRSERP